jgi:hypothetical protein
MRSAEGRRPEAAKKDERRDEGSWGEGGAEDVRNLAQKSITGEAGK